MLARLMPRSLAVALLLAGLLVVALLSLPGTASADSLIEAEPAPGETIGEQPDVILLRFDRELELRRGVNDVQVFDAEGRRVDDGEAQVAGYGGRTMIAHLAEAVEEGELTVVWGVRFAGSGQDVRGEFDFAIDAGAPEREGPAVAVSEPRSTQSIVLWTIAIIIAVGLFALLLFYLRVATDNAKSSLEDPGDSQH